MTKLSHIAPRFVETIPKILEDGVLYVSETYGTASHKCACGCGARVVTPLTPTDWEVVREKDGSVSLSPSIGNWDYPCQSHYWINHNQIEWAPKWSRSRIKAGRRFDLAQKAGYFSERGWDRRGWFDNILTRIKSFFD
jgi:hypothetical protein